MSKQHLSPVSRIALRIVCPFCGAEQGKLCTGIDDARFSPTHTDREREAVSLDRRGRLP